MAEHRGFSFSTVFFFFFFFFAVVSAIASAAEEPHGFLQSEKLVKKPVREKLSHLRFYWHDVVSGPDPTAVPVAQATNASASGFGTVVIIDDPMTVGPELSSRLVGRAQGFYALAAKEEAALLMAMNLAFVEGKYNGSTIAVLGRNAVFSGVREMPVVGGSGLFRLARGYAQARTYSFDNRTHDAVVEYNVFLAHGHLGTELEFGRMGRASGPGLGGRLLVVELRGVGAFIATVTGYSYLNPLSSLLLTISLHLTMSSVVLAELNSSTNPGDLAEKVNSGTNPGNLVEKVNSGTNSGDLAERVNSGTNPGDLAERVNSGTNSEDLAEKVNSITNLGDLAKKVNSSTNPGDLAEKMSNGKAPSTHAAAPAREVGVSPAREAPKASSKRPIDASTEQADDLARRHKKVKVLTRRHKSRHGEGESRSHSKGKEPAVPSEEPDTPAESDEGDASLVHHRPRSMKDLFKTKVHKGDAGYYTLQMFDLGHQDSEKKMKAR
ncbi:hypothetical protein BHM03_00053061 [Ensete ventricosum]|nr:hypothetical protein BHM03_00053061 [Ensete ventricosum]